MAKLVLLLALLCVQFSRGEERVLHQVTEEQSIPAEAGVQFEGPNGDKLTEEDWLEEIEDLLDEEDEDYDVNHAEFRKLVGEIEKLMNEHHPDRGGYKWLQEIAKWFDAADAAGDDYEDESDDESDEALVDFYHWMYRTNVKNNGRLLQKRFSSV